MTTTDTTKQSRKTRKGAKNGEPQAIDAVLAKLDPEDLERFRGWTGAEAAQRMGEFQDALSDAAGAPVTSEEAIEYLARLQEGFQPAAALSQRLKRLHGEVVEINHTVFLTDAALGSGDGWALEELVAAGKVSLTYIRERLVNVAEELELIEAAVDAAGKPTN